jgi:membrane associated rhomboid family serine protease
MSTHLIPPYILLLIVIALISLKGFNDRDWFDRYSFQINAIKNGQWYRMISSGFLHVGFWHLLVNGISYYFFAPTVYRLLGSTSFFILFMAALLAGNLFTLWVHKNESFYSAVGASGAVSGIVYSSILLYPGMQLMIMPIPLPIPAPLFGFGFLMYSVYGMYKNTDRIGHAAHFGGAIGGFTLTALLKPALFLNNSTLTLVLVIPLLLFFWVLKRRN